MSNAASSSSSFRSRTLTCVDSTVLSEAAPIIENNSKAPPHDDRQTMDPSYYNLDGSKHNIFEVSTPTYI